MLTNLLKQTCHCVGLLPCHFLEVEKTLVALCKPEFTSHISSDSLLHNIFAILVKDNYESERYNDCKHTYHEQLAWVKCKVLTSCSLGSLPRLFILLKVCPMTILTELLSIFNTSTI